MHITSNIRNLELFLKFFPFLDADVPSDEYLAHCNSVKDLRAHNYDLVIAKVVLKGSTITEDRDGTERELKLGEWIVAPLIGRESSLGHSSVLPREGIAVGAVIDYISSGGGLGISIDNPPGKINATKVEVMGILRDHDGRVAKSLNFPVTMRTTGKLCPVIAVVGSRSDAGKTTACLDVIKNLHEIGKCIGVAKLSGTAQRKEILELAVHANQWLDTADVGLPTTYPPSQDNDDRARFTVEQAVLAAERILQELSIDNEIIIVEFGGDLLSASVPELLANPFWFNIVAVLMVAESATAAIGMETKLYKISERYKRISKYIVGPCTNLQANRNRISRETDCTGCYDLWNKHNKSATSKQVDASLNDTRELTLRLLADCMPEA